jgi:hypothetical protein
MFQRAIAATVAAAFLAVIGMGCNGPEAQPVLKNTNIEQLKKEPQKNKPTIDD